MPRTWRCSTAIPCSCRTASGHPRCACRMALLDLLAMPVPRLVPASTCAGHLPPKTTHNHNLTLPCLFVLRDPASLRYAARGLQLHGQHLQCVGLGSGRSARGSPTPPGRFTWFPSSTSRRARGRLFMVSATVLRKPVATTARSSYTAALALPSPRRCVARLLLLGCLGSSLVVGVSWAVSLCHKSLAK